MNKTLALTALLTATLALTACAKNENTTPVEQDAAPAVTEEQMSPEQQAAIDSIDQPILDEKNTDIPAEIANAPADVATADSANAASELAAE